MMLRLRPTDEFPVELRLFPGACRRESRARAKAKVGMRTMPERHFKTIRLDDAAVSTLLDRLDSSKLGPGTRDGIAFYAYRAKGVVVYLHQPGSAGSIPYSVSTRLLSNEHLVFLHGGFIYPNTPCSAQLITRHGTWINVEGTVLKCSLVEGNIHEVQVHFKRAVDPTSCCADAVSCRVLVVDDEPVSLRLADFHLGQLRSKIEHASDGAEAIQKALAEPYDVILMDINMPNMSGLEAVKVLRERGYRGSIVALTASSRPGDREECLNAGFDGFVTKPYTRSHLSQALDAARQEAVLSTFDDDPTMADLIHAFVAELPKTLQSIEAAFASEDWVRVEHLVRTLKGEGSSHGFDVITATAQEVESGIQRGLTVSQLKRSLESLIKLCTSVRASEG